MTDCSWEFCQKPINLQSCQKMSKCVKMCQNVSKCVKMCLNVSKCVKMSEKSVKTAKETNIGQKVIGLQTDIFRKPSSSLSRCSHRSMTFVIFLPRITATSMLECQSSESATEVSNFQQYAASASMRLVR